MKGVVVAGAVCLLALGLLSAQSARTNKPAPRLANGKPSMAGVWDNTRRADVTNPAIPGFVKELPYTAWGRTKW